MCCLLKFFSPKIVLKTTKRENVRSASSVSEDDPCRPQREAEILNDAGTFAWGAVAAFMRRSHCLFLVDFLLLCLV